MSEDADVTLVITLRDHGPVLLPCRYAYMSQWSHEVTPITWWTKRDAPPPKWFIPLRIELKHQVFVLHKDRENIEWARGWITEESDEGRALIAAFALMSETVTCL